MSSNKHKKKSVLVGPILPFRGGIAQHSTMLHRAMRKMAEHRTLSFSRQYPAWLFPGKSDRDSGHEGHLEDGVEYVIDSLNPFTWEKAVQRILSFCPDVVVMPWWTVYWAPCFGYLSRRLVQQKIEVVFFCHNVLEHETGAWKHWLTRMVLKGGTRFVVHTREDETNLKHLLQGATVAVQAHPVYEQFPPALGVLPRRHKLELLFFGLIRPYKGIDILIDAVGDLKCANIQLTVAGEFWEGQKAIRAQINALGIQHQVEILDRYHSEQETAELFARADIIVLPYRSATGSGVVPLAYHYNRPVVVTRVGGLPDSVVEGETGFIIPANDREALSNLLRSLRAEQCKAMIPAIKRLKASMTWEKLASLVLH